MHLNCPSKSCLEDKGIFSEPHDFSDLIRGDQFCFPYEINTCHQILLNQSNLLSHFTKLLIYRNEYINIHI